MVLEPTADLNTDAKQGYQGPYKKIYILQKFS